MTLKPIIISCLIALLACLPTYAKVYVYELPDGSSLITDKKSYKKGYTLKKSYNTGSKRSTSKRRYRAKSIKTNQYDKLIVNAARKYGLEPAFIKAVIHTESAFNRYAISRAGALGLMQLMPATASNYKLHQDYFDPKSNIEIGTQHLKELMSRYNSNKTLSLAAYNAGAGAVSKYRGVPPYDETQAYVKKVIKLYNKYKTAI